jgi:hypothetical protein
LWNAKELRLESLGLVIAGGDIVVVVWGRKGRLDENEREEKGKVGN